MTEKAILSEIYQLPEHLRLEVLHFVSFLKKEYAGTNLSPERRKRVFGRAKGKYKMCPDFDQPLEDSKIICK